MTLATHTSHFAETRTPFSLYPSRDIPLTVSLSTQDMPAMDKLFTTVEKYESMNITYLSVRFFPYFLFHCLLSISCGVDFVR